jgi:hypothetical protein
MCKLLEQHSSLWPVCAVHHDSYSGLGDLRAHDLGPPGLHPAAYFAKLLQ